MLASWQLFWSKVDPRVNAPLAKEVDTEQRPWFDLMILISGYNNVWSKLKAQEKEGFGNLRLISRGFSTVATQNYRARRWLLYVHWRTL